MKRTCPFSNHLPDDMNNLYISGIFLSSLVEPLIRVQLLIFIPQYLQGKKYGYVGWTPLSSDYEFHKLVNR